MHPVLDTIHRHRSIRRYKPDPVPGDLLNNILAAGITNLAQIYTVVKCSRESHQDFSRSVLGYLAAQGFMENHTD